MTALGLIVEDAKDREEVGHLGVDKEASEEPGSRRLLFPPLAECSHSFSD